MNGRSGDAATVKRQCAQVMAGGKRCEGQTTHSSGRCLGHREAIHSTRLVLARAYQEWVPECSCGWVGSYWHLQRSASAEAARHREAEL